MSTERLKITSIVIAVTLLAVSIFMWDQLSGFEYGFFYGVFQEPPSTGFSADGPNYYQSLNIWYLWVSVCLCSYLVVKFVGDTITTSVICIFVLTIIIFVTWNMLHFKNEVVVEVHRNEFYPTPYPWLQSSIYSDWLCLVATVVLIFVEVWMIRLGFAAESIGEV